jgi:hypothetical protein
MKWFTTRFILYYQPTSFIVFRSLGKLTLKKTQSQELEFSGSLYSGSWTSEAKDCALKWQHHNLWKQGFCAKCFPPDLKAQLCQEHTRNFRSIAHSSKKIKTPKLDFIHWSKLAIPGTPIVHPRFSKVLNPQFILPLEVWLTCITFWHVYLTKLWHLEFAWTIGVPRIVILLLYVLDFGRL